MANIWLLAIFLIPIVILIILRVNAVFVYLGLCLGYVLSQFDDNNKYITKIAGSKTIEHLGGTNNIHLLLVLLPAVVIILTMMKTTSGGKFSLNLLPAIAVGLLAVITIVPLLPVNTAVKVMQEPLWTDVTKYQGALIAASTLVVTVLLILQASKFSHLHKKPKHHHKPKE